MTLGDETVRFIPAFIVVIPGMMLLAHLECRNVVRCLSFTSLMSGGCLFACFSLFCSCFI